MEIAAIQAAVAAWVRTGSGLATGQVIWETQNARRPDGQYIAMRITALRQNGHDWVTLNDDDEYEVSGPRSATLTLQCFTGAEGELGAMHVLEKVRVARSLPSIASALHAASVGIGSMSTIQSIGANIGATVFEPRAIMTVTLHLVQTLTEAGEWFDTIEISNDDLNLTNTVEL